VRLQQPVNRSPSPPQPGSLPGGVGVLVVGHGTADPVGAAETRAVAEQAAVLLPGVPVALGFLEVIGPTIDDALSELAAAGCHTVAVAPLLLFAAGHAKRDVPEAIQAAASGRGIRVVQAEPLGCHPGIIALSCRRRAEATLGLAPRSPDETAVVMIGRGSSDPTALSQIREVATATGASEITAHDVGFGFVAAARPAVADALAAAARRAEQGVRRIIVQPHLLFRGHVEEQVAAAVGQARQTHPALEWLQVARLGADQLVAEAVVDRGRAALLGCTSLG